MTAFVLPSVDNDNLISALTTKKDEIKSQISSLKAEITRLSSGLSHIDATIGLLSGNNSDKKAVSRTYKHHFFKPNDRKTLILDNLRVLGPISTNDIAKNIADSYGIDQGDLVVLQKTILYSLRSLENKGLIKVVGKDGLSFVWSIA